MTRFKINKRLKVAICILLICVFGMKIHLSYKKHVEYKRIKKPTQSKKVKIYKKFSINKKKEITFNEKDLFQYHNILKSINDKQNYNLQEQIKLHNKQYDEKQAERKRQEQIKKQQNNVKVNRGEQSSQGRPVKLRISYYTVSFQDCGNTRGITSSGLPIQSDMIAAPNNIKFGTQISIPSMGRVFTVQDRGGAIGYEGDTMMIDVYVPNATQSQLNKLGVKYTNGYILK